MKIMDSTECVIEELLRHRFSLRSYEEKKKIINNGRLTAPLPNLQTKGKNFVRHFQTSLYEKNKWLTGSSKLNRLFCWPCLLFSPDKTVWNDKGYNDLNNLYISMQKHERSQRHIKSYLFLKSFDNVSVDVMLDDQKRFDIQQHNEKVSRNREIFRRLIDAVIFLGCQELSFQGHNETNESNNCGNYVELLYLMSHYDEKLANHLSTSTVFSGLWNRIQNDLIESVQNVILSEIHSEISDTKFIAIILDETSDVSDISQLSTVLRYITKESEIVERFIGFTDVSLDRSVDALTQHVFRCIENVKGETKLICQTYDGAPTVAGYLHGLQSKVKEKYPSAIFVHCCAHVLNLVLSQACGGIKECKLFFTVLGGLGSFFAKSPKRTSALDSIVKRRFPKSTPVRWDYSSSLVHTAKEYRPLLIELFDEIINNADKWDEMTINSAIGFSHKLNDFDFNFLLEVFSEIFSFTDVLFNVLQTKCLDITYCANEVKKTTKLIEEKKELFSKIYDRIKENFSSAKHYDYYRNLYSNIIQIVLNQLKVRFKSLENLVFIELLNTHKFKQYAKNFPKEPFQSLITTYGKYFDQIRLQNELIVAYSSNDFGNKNIVELMKHFQDNQFYEVMPEFSNLCHLIATMPFTTSIERSFSSLKRIKVYQRNTTSETRLPGLALMAIERNFLLKLQNSEDFYEKVIEEFIKKKE